VAKYMVRRRKPPSQTWPAFLNNHVKTLVSVDFFTVPTIGFQVLYVFLVLAHERRRLVHFNVRTPDLEESMMTPIGTRASDRCRGKAFR
jgi:putative transposase